jgi:hypothetical protein
MRHVFAILVITCLIGKVCGQNTFPTTGNAGIGTTSPQANLHLYSTLQNPRVHIQSTASNGAPGYTIAETNGTEAWTWHYNISGGYMGFHRYGLGNTLVISNTGKVGIGTNNPLSRLDLGELKISDLASFPTEGSITDDWGSYIVGNINGGQKLRLGVANDGNTKAEIYLENNNTPNGSISFKTAAGAGAITRMYIDANGRVGIGTTSIGTGYKLFVEEGIRTRKVKVDQQTWPDYVFHPSYSLRPLSEVEKHIKEHQHLPGVPSAEEVIKNGIDLGENQAVLLKKIEELTLYLLQQEKRITQLEAKIESIEKSK